MGRPISHQPQDSGAADGGTVPAAAPERSGPRLGILPEILLIGVAGFLILAVLFYAAWRQDTARRDASRGIVETLLNREVSALVQRSEDLIWTIADLLPTEAGTAVPGETAAKIGAVLNRRYAWDGFYLFDNDNRMVFSSERTDPNGGQARPPVAGLRALAGKLTSSPPEATAMLAGPIGGGEPGTLTLSAIRRLPRPETGSGAANGKIAAGGLVAIVTRRLGPSSLDAVGREFGLSQLSLTVQDGNDGWTVAGIDGGPVGRLVWETEQPGRRMLETALLPVLCLLAAMGGLGLLAFRRSTAIAQTAGESSRLVAAVNLELEANRQRFRDFAEAASDWFWETDRDLTYTYISERLAAVLACPPATVMGERLTDLGPLAGNAVSWVEALADISAGRPFRDLEIAYTEPSESDQRRRTFIFRLSGQPVLGADGGFAGYRGSGVDVTAETLALVEARFMQALVNDALNSISEGFVLFNADGRLVVCNERYRQAYPNLADVLVPGATFEEVLRVAAERGGVQDRESDISAWIRERLARHLENPEPIDRRLSDGRWYRISEHATGSGGVVKLLMDITELKEREQELAGQTARLKGTLDSISHGVGMFDNADCLAAWNDDFPRMLGLPRGYAAFGRPLVDFAKEAATLSPALAAAFCPDHAGSNNPALHQHEWGREPIRAGDRFMEVRRTLIPDGGVVVSLADVTERHRMDAVLRDLAQTVPASGVLFFQNLALALARAAGCDAAIVAEVAPRDRLHPLGYAVDGEIIGDVPDYSTGTTPCGKVVGRSLALFARSVRSLFPDDGRLMVLKAEGYCGAPLFDSGGRPLGVVAVISRRPLEEAEFVRNLLQVFAGRAAAELERQRSIDALRESEGRYRQLVELAPYGIAIWDRHAIRFANSAAVAILGVNTSGHDAGSAPSNGAGEGPRAAVPALMPPGLEGARLAPFFHDGDTLEANLRDCREGQIRRVECEVLRPSGESRDIELSAYGAAFRGDNAVLLVFNDITERLRAEAELQRAQKMEAVGRMAGGIAHEFNNMLTAIGGFARLAERNPEDAKRVLTCVKEIAKASDRAAALTSQLLDYSRRRVTDELERVEIAAMVRDLRVFLKPLISTGIALDLDIRTDEIYAVANPVTLNQALLNLAINARDAMTDGGTVTITLDRVVPDDGLRRRHEQLTAETCVLLRVTDDGTGIPEEVRDRIWEPFFTTKEQGKGTGLGLWIVYGTVHQAGGAIEMETEVGKGTVFSIYLPEVPAPAKPKDGHGNSLLDEGEKAYILLVDDEESVRAYLRLALEEAGCVVTEACDGMDALDKYDIAGGLFDAVVTDISMPNMNGAELASALAERNPELRILFLTGYASRDMASGLTARPGWRLLMKPIDPERLVAAVRTLIND